MFLNVDKRMIFAYNYMQIYYLIGTSGEVIGQALFFLYRIGYIIYFEIAHILLGKGTLMNDIQIFDKTWLSS